MDIKGLPGVDFLVSSSMGKTIEIPWEYHASLIGIKSFSLVCLHSSSKCVLALSYEGAF